MVHTRDLSLKNKWADHDCKASLNYISLCELHETLSENKQQQIKDPITFHNIPEVSHKVF